MLDIYHNKGAFLKEKPKNLFFISLLFVSFLLLFLVLSFKTETYDHYLTKGYVKCEGSCILTTFLPTNISYQKIKINDQDWSPIIIEKEVEISEENMMSYYRISFSMDNTFLDNEIVDLNFYYHKQRLLNKIWQKMF